MAVVDNDKDENFAFTCTSDYVNIAESLQVPKSKLGSCIDSGASEVYCPEVRFTVRIEKNLPTIN